MRFVHAVVLKVMKWQIDAFCTRCCGEMVKYLNDVTIGCVICIY